MRSSGSDLPTDRAHRLTRRLGRSGVAKIVTDSKPILGPDYRKLPVLVSITFVMGLIEAILLLLIVQMAVALAAGKDHFDVGLGPISLTDISLYSGVMAGVVLVTSLVGLLIPVARMTGRLAAQAQYRTRERIVASYLRARWDVRSKYPEGHLQELVTTFTQRTEHAVNQLVNASTALCGLAAIMLTAFVSSPVVAAGAVVCVAGLGGLLRPIMKLTRTASSEFAVSNRDFASRMAEIGRITPEITTFDVAQRVETSIDGHAVQVAGQLRRIRMLSRLSSSLYQYAALLLIVVAIGAVVALADRDGLATMGTVLLLLIRALAYGQQLQTQVQASNETAPFLKMVEDEIASLSSAQVSRGGTRIGGPTPLRFDNVWFAYEPHQHVIRGITFEVAHGESIGIVGRSGAGKSTLIQLLLRLHTPTGGTILADGVALDSVALSLWYEMVAYVPQDNKLISGTVAENIRFFRPYLPDASVHDAARRAHLHDDILGLPDGYDTRIGMGVRELSGGQRQRLGIARALAGDPQLLILDEPTSALDARSETLVSETLHKLRGTVTTIIITHRPATTAYCDRILRIDAGQVSVEKPSSSGLVAHASPSAQEAHP